MKTPEIIILSGIPCSGKTTYRHPLEEEGYWVICRDDIRDMYWGRDYKYNRDNENKVTEISNKSFFTAIRNNLDIIIDATHCKEVYIQEWIKRKPSNYNLKVVFFDIPLWKAYIRNVLRWLNMGKWIPFQVIRDMKKNYDRIDKSKYQNLHL